MNPNLTRGSMVGTLESKNRGTRGGKTCQEFPLSSRGVEIAKKRYPLGVNLKRKGIVFDSAKSFD